MSRQKQALIYLGMYKPSKNPKIEELTKSHRERTCPLGNIPPVKVEGAKLCVWCLGSLKGAQRKWCSQECINSGTAWGYPQKEQALQFLLIRQNFQCNGCQYDYKSTINDKIIGRYYGTKTKTDYMKEMNEYIMIRLKQCVPSDRKPEVDHIIPISKGGDSLGLANHQVYCVQCHKAKTKIDNSGPRKNKTSD